MLKAAIMGLIGGIIGYVAGVLIAWFLGPYIAGINIAPIPVLLLWSVIISVFISLVGSVLPAWFAARFEPYSNMQEV